MVCRTFPIRVQSPAAGTSGPMAHETDWDKVAQTAGVDAAILREKEKTSTTKRQRRVSEFDWSLLRKAAQLNGPTDIALTFADYLSPDNKNAKRYDQLTAETQEFIRDVEAVAVAPVSFVATGFGFQTIIDRRCWRE
jgi:adenylosuccinate synthase